MQGPRLYRFFNYELPLYLPAPTGGWNPDANPWELPISEASQLDNFLIRPGKIVMRGPFKQDSDLSSFFGAPLNIAGILTTFDGGLIGRKDQTASGQVDPWNAPLLNPTSAQLAVGKLSGIKWTLDSSGGNWATQTYATADSVPGPRSINFYGLWYGLSFDSAGAAVQDASANYSIKPLSLFTVSPSYAITVLSSAPHGAFDLKGYQSRIWLLGGIDTPGAGTTHDPLALFFTNPIAAGGGSATADWQDPVSGLTNKIVMDGDAHDFGVGLATVRNGLVIFRRGSIYLLKGSTTANYTLIPISKSVGCVDARSIVETDIGVYFMSSRGLMFTNGTSIVNVSGSIQYTLRTAINAEQFAVRSGLQGYITCALTNHGQVLISIGAQAFGAPAGTYTPLLSAMYDPQVDKGGAWVRITSNLWSGDSNGNTQNYAGQLWSHVNPHRVMSFGDKYQVMLEDDARSYSFVDPGSTGAGGAFGTNNPGLYDKSLTGSTPIPATWQTVIPAITVANKRVTAIAKRYYMDYNFMGSNPGGGYPIGLITTGWTVTPEAADGTQLDTPQGVPADSHGASTGVITGYSLVPHKTITRWNHDWWPEIEDITFTVSWQESNRATPSGNVIAEIYGLGLEFQRSRDLRS